MTSGGPGAVSLQINGGLTNVRAGGGYWYNGGSSFNGAAAYHFAGGSRFFQIDWIWEFPASGMFRASNVDTKYFDDAGDIIYSMNGGVAYEDSATEITSLSMVAIGTFSAGFKYELQVRGV